MKQLILRTCKQNLKSFKNFQWKMGMNIAPDWDPKPKCGKGLHGLLWGEGDGLQLAYSSSSKRLISEIDEYVELNDCSKWLIGEIEEYVDLGGCVKFPSCNVIFIGDQEQATQFLYKNSKDKAICGLIMSGKNIVGGECCRLTGEDGANIVVGNHSRVIVGNDSTITAGYNCTISHVHKLVLTATGPETYITQNGMIVPKEV